MAKNKKSVRKGILFGTQGKCCSRGDEMNVEMPLLEYLAYRAGCRWLSDLHCLDGCQRIRLHHVLEQLPPEAAPLAVPELSLPPQAARLSSIAPASASANSFFMLRLLFFSL